MTATAWSVELDELFEDDYGELPAFEGQDQAHRDAAASDALRAMGAIDAEIRRRETALRLELENVTARYERALTPLRKRRAVREDFVKTLAQLSAQSGGFGKKAKSRAVGFGVYGSRQKARHIEVTSALELAAWAIKSKPTLLRVKVPMDYTRASLLLEPAEMKELKGEVLITPLAAYINETGEIPPGVKEVPESDEYYAKPEPFDDIAQVDHCRECDTTEGVTKGWCARCYVAVKS